MRRAVGLTIIAAVGLACDALAQLTPSDLTALRERGQREGWTFTVGPTEATRYPDDQAFGLKVPADWRRGARFDPCPPRRDLPVAFDWRTANGCTPIKNQLGCGACWAFGLNGAFESQILLQDGVAASLSEQWLISCCGLGGCGGEWPGNAANFYLLNGSWLDECGHHGTVPTSEFPFVASDVPCGCPYTHDYFLEDWAFIGPEWGIPTEAQLKQAIYDHGPIVVCVYANNAMKAYSSGIFNACEDVAINHTVVLVGWDDNQGTAGVWLMRNSWGAGWGENGYCRIEYGCSRIGYNALYVVYAGLDQVIWADFTYSGIESGTFSKPYNTLAEGVNAVTSGGTLRIKAGASAVTPTLAKVMRIEAHGGSVTIGQ
jgi:hypothetical protein